MRLSAQAEVKKIDIRITSQHFATFRVLGWKARRPWKAPDDDADEVVHGEELRRRRFGQLARHGIDVRTFVYTNIDTNLRWE